MDRRRGRRRRPGARVAAPGSLRERRRAAALRDRGLAFAPDADRRTLIRRLSLDLTGLVPTPEEVEAFVADTSADAYDRLVDRLLDSPAYGERQARHRPSPCSTARSRASRAT